MRRARTFAAETGPTTFPTPSRARPIFRVAATAAALALTVVATRQGTSEAAPPAVPTSPSTILPTSLGEGIATQQAFDLDFASPMNADSVAASLTLHPESTVRLSWSPDARHLSIAPVSHWQTDTRYALDVAANTRLANGSILGAPLRYTFTTQTAPSITGFAVNPAGASRSMARLSLQETAYDSAAPPADTADRISARTSITVAFSAGMNQSEVEHHFVVSPTVRGTFAWQGTSVTFTPSTRLKANARYAIAVLGAHDLQGNLLGGDISFSFNTVSAVRAVRVSPADGAKAVIGRVVRVAFSGQVDTRTIASAFRLSDLSLKRPVYGSLTWNASHTQLAFTPKQGLRAGHSFEIRIGAGSTDADGNAILATYRFTTRSAPKAATTPVAAPAATYRPVVSVQAPSGSAQSYALLLINASRRAYGFAPLRLDAAISAVAQAHAVDQAVNGYFSHNSLNGATPQDRLRAAGISFTRSGENQCYDYGSVTSAIAWCHSVMMAEPYPGYWNHIGNILNPNFTRVGFGYARAGNGELIMTWDFTN